MRKSTKICLINLGVMFFNLIAVLISDYVIGGNASNGKIENGIYYVMSSAG